MTGTRPGNGSSQFVPVIRSTYDPGALAVAVERGWGLSNMRLQLIKGTFRDTYRVESATGRFILSVYRHGLRSVQEIQAELDLLAYLDAQGVPVVPALLRPSGDLMLPLTAPEGDRVAALFRHVDGEPLSKNPDPAAASAYGNAIARVHVVADAFPLPLSRPRITPYDLLERPLGALAMVLGKWDDRVAELREAARILRPILDRRPVSGSEYGLIHGDVIPSNAHVGPDGTVTLLDFDFCGYGWRALDIATYLMEVDWWETSPQAGQAFLDEYQQVRPLSDGEIAALPSLEAARAIAALGTPAREVNVWGSAYLSPAMVDRTLAVVRACLARAR